jgi:hypothetical protein
MPEPITHQMFLNWLDHPVTRRLVKDMRDARQKTLELLGDYYRGSEQPNDDRLRGFIRGIDEVLSWETGDGDSV